MSKNRLPHISGDKKTQSCLPTPIAPRTGFSGRDKIERNLQSQNVQEQPLLKRAPTLCGMQKLAQVALASTGKTHFLELFSGGRNGSPRHPTVRSRSRPRRRRSSPQEGKPRLSRSGNANLFIMPAKKKTITAQKQTTKPAANTR